MAGIRRQPLADGSCHSGARGGNSRLARTGTRAHRISASVLDTLVLASSPREPKAVGGASMFCSSLLFGVCAGVICLLLCSSRGVANKY